MDSPLQASTQEARPGDIPDNRPRPAMGSLEAIPGNQEVTQGSSQGVTRDNSREVTRGSNQEATQGKLEATQDKVGNVNEPLLPWPNLVPPSISRM